MLSNVLLPMISVSITAPALTAPGFQGLGDLSGGQFNSNAYGVSADGLTVVGQSASSSGNQAFSWTESGGIVGLSDFNGGAFDCAAHAVSEHGEYTVGWGTTSSGRNAAAWFPGVDPWNLGDLSGGPTNARLLAVPAYFGGGVIGVGDGFDANGRKALLFTITAGPLTLGELHPGDQSVARGISGNANVIVGDSEYSDHSQIEAFRWTLAGGIVGLGDLDGGGFRSSAIAISIDSNVIVGYGESELGIEAMHWTMSDGMTGLGDLPGGGFYSIANATSGDGSTIVGVGTISTGEAAFVWTSEGGMRDLQSLLTEDLDLDLAGWSLTAATGVSADGLTIVGTGINPAGDTEAWIARIPEPATLPMVIVGAVALFRRKRIIRRQH